MKNVLLVQTLLDLIHNLTYYFYLVYVIYHFYLTKITLFISISISTKFMINKEKKTFLSKDLCVLWSEIFLRMVFSSVLWVVPKNFSCCQSWWQTLVNTSLISHFQENVSIFLLTPWWCLLCDL